MANEQPRKQLHDPVAALAFLRVLRPDGPWLLTAIAVDQRGIDTRQFAGDDDAGIASFLDRFGDRNVYYMLNPHVGSLAEKADKSEVDAVAYLHVDVDPRELAKPEPTREELVAYVVEERTRIRGKFSPTPSPVPRPSGLIDSGGGYQALWRLDVPSKITGDNVKAREKSCEDVERYNRALEWAFGGDHCHNADRILRLPGTLNYPDTKKRAKGRSIARSSVVWFDAIGSHPLSAFVAAEPVQSSGGGIASTRTARPRPATAVATSVGNVRRWAIDELEAAEPWGPRINKRTLIKIVQGVDPDDRQVLLVGDRGARRSEWLFNVCCDLVRAGVPDAVIYSVITDKDYKISSSVLDNKNVERYANRQIERAKEDAIHPRLREFNERFAVIENHGGKCLVMEEVYDEVMQRDTLSLQAFEHFGKRFDNLSVQIGVDKKNQPITMPLGKFWLHHESRKQFERIVFAPGREITGAYNMWQGFAFEARPGTGHEKFLAHVKANLCGGNEEIYSYLIGWMARAIQHPADTGEVAVVLRGERGAGKGTFAHVFGKLFGRHYLYLSSAHHLVGHFNAALRDSVLVFADEAFFAGDKQHEGALKALITEPTLMIENKGLDATQSRNCVHLIMASNSSWVVPVGHHERRFLVLDVLSDRRQDEPYFAALRADLEANGNAGYASLLYYLQGYDLSRFTVRTVPQTIALREQRMLSLDPMDEWWFRKLEDGIIVSDHLEWQAPICKEAIVDDFLRYTSRVGARRSTETTLGHFLNRVVPGIQSYQRRQEICDERGRRIVRRQFWELPALDKCRAAFSSSRFGSHEWPTIQCRDDVPEAASAF
jgi:hypothetical protein